MNIPILKKCVDELKADKPNLQYILGMLETLIAMTDPLMITSNPMFTAKKNSEPIIKVDEEITDEQKQTAERYARAGLGRLA